MRQTRMHPGPPDFLIVGTPRSGTTLVQRLASELDGVSVPPETHFFRLFAPGLLARRGLPLTGEALVDELDAYSRLDDVRGVELDPELTARHLGGRAATVMDLFGGIVRELAGDAALYGEKTPSHLRWWRELSAAGPELRLVAVVRDPRAVVASYLEAWGERPHSVIAERWAIDHRALGSACDALDGRCLVQRYEDVVTDPDAARDELSGFLGRPPGTLERGAAVKLRLPWESWKATSEGPVTTDRIDGWRRALSERAVRQISTIAGGEMRRFGYEVDEAPAHLEPRDQWLRLRYRAARARESAHRRRLARRPGFA